MIEGVQLTELRIIEVEGGDVLHAMKRSDPGFNGYGEAYFSTVEHGATKAWKRHRSMVMNLVVPVGKIRFVLYDDREASPTYGRFSEFLLSRENYQRLTVPPMVWIGFQGVDGTPSLLLNVADIEHDPQETDRVGLEEFDFSWKVEE